MAVYKRIIIKLSGEALTCEGAEGVYDKASIDRTAKAIADVVRAGVQVGIVCGGGNIWRGRFDRSMDAVTGDYMGMLATVINALCLKDALTRAGVEARVQTAVEMRTVAEQFVRDKAIQHLENGRVVIFAGGTGNPHFTTDTAAALRASEIGADAILKGTTVDALYDSDPRKNPDAKPIYDITYADCVAKELHVMDITAFTICREQQVPQIRVFSAADPENLLRVVNGEKIGSTVHM